MHPNGSIYWTVREKYGRFPKRPGSSPLSRPLHAVFPPPLWGADLARPKLRKAPSTSSAWPGGIAKLGARSLGTILGLRPKSRHGDCGESFSAVSGGTC